TAKLRACASISMKPERKASNMDFDSMKYADLQSLAKGLGLKANMKKQTEKLLKAIKQHYEQKAEKSQTSTETSAKQENFNPPVFVNTRRGKKIGGKRKISDVAAVAGPGEASPAPACGSRAGKKRKVSSARDADGQEQPEISKTLSILRSDCAIVYPCFHLLPEKKSKMAKSNKIPRLQKKHGTPNFKKLHEAHFNKMESIDSYVQRRTRNLDTHRDSTKEFKKTKQQTSRAAEERRRHTTLPAAKAPPNKPAGKDDAAFRPSVFSTRRLNIRFSEATGDNENKRPVVKTPGRMSSCVASSTPLKQASDAGKRKTAVFSATKTPVTPEGPFVFTGNASCVSTPGTQKPKFDLKASLSRPLTYKPHTGKLKPFGDAKENPSANKSLVSVGTRQKNYKQHQAKTREDRRAEQAKDRRQKKEGVLGARRGLVMM
uniref:Nucleolar and spindle associated protein 1 n=1 Tax=Tetraodon nigroviridis TaxID=99883 RepID=H3DPV8_TETNG